MPSRPITLGDVARAVGTSLPTVSQVLSGQARARRISERLEARVLSAARRLGYRPNLLARSLRTRRSMTIGILLPNLCQTFYPAVVAAFQQEVRGKGYLLLLSNHYEDATLMDEELSLLEQRMIDGLVIGPPAGGRAAMARVLAFAARMPSVAFDWHHSRIDSVFNSPASLSLAAARHFQSKSIRRVLGITLNDPTAKNARPRDSRARMQRFLAAFSGVGRSVETWEVTGAEDLAERVRRGSASGFLSRFEGCFCTNTILGESFVGELLSVDPAILRRILPVMISGNLAPTPLGRHVAVVHQDPAALGQALASRLLLRLGGVRLRPARVEIPPRLVERS